MASNSLLQGVTALSSSVSLFFQTHRLPAFQDPHAHSAAEISRGKTCMIE